MLTKGNKYVDDRGVLILIIILMFPAIKRIFIENTNINFIMDGKGHAIEKKRWFSVLMEVFYYLKL